MSSKTEISIQTMLKLKCWMIKTTNVETRKTESIRPTPLFQCHKQTKKNNKKHKNSFCIKKIKTSHQGFRVITKLLGPVHIFKYFLTHDWLNPLLFSFRYRGYGIVTFICSLWTDLPTHRTRGSQLSIILWRKTGRFKFGIHNPEIQAFMSVRWGRRRQ